MPLVFPEYIHRKPLVSLPMTWYMIKMSRTTSTTLFGQIILVIQKSIFWGGNASTPVNCSGDSKSALNSLTQRLALKFLVMLSIDND